jgi:hypothetical protein
LLVAGKPNRWAAQAEFTPSSIVDGIPFPTRTTFYFDN